MASKNKNIKKNKPIISKVKSKSVVKKVVSKKSSLKKNIVSVKEKKATKTQNVNVKLVKKSKSKIASTKIIPIVKTVAVSGDKNKSEGVKNNRIELSKKEKLGNILKVIKKTVIINLPKIKTKNTIKYKPIQDKSILNREVNSKVQRRYSDADLKVFKELILQKLEISKNELFYLQGILSKKDEFDNNSSRSEVNEDNFDREQFAQMARRQQQFIDHLEKALMRIENKTYGICRVTGNLISKERLKAVPHATLSIEAKMMEVNNRGGNNSNNANSFNE